MSDYEFDSVICKDKVEKGVHFGELKLMLDGLKDSHSAGTRFENGCVVVWCEMNKRRYCFKYQLPEGATIDESSISIRERSKGKMKIFFKKTSDFKLRK